MRIPFLGFLVILLNICVLPLSAQPEADPDGGKDVPKEVKKANVAYDAQQYTEAIELLKDALGEVRGREDKSDIMFKIAECYRQTLQYKNAQTYYEKAIKVGYKDPIALLHKANMIKAQGNYEEAIVAYQEFKEANPGDPRGDIGITSTKEAKDWMSKPNRYQVDNMKDLNDASYDFAPVYAGGKKGENILIFTSTREENVGKRVDGWTGGEFTDIYISEADRKGGGRRRRGAPVADDKLESPANLKWSTPVLLDEGIINTDASEGSATYDSRAKKLYFTRCLNEKNEKLGCGIYVTEKLGTTWKAPERLIIGDDTLANVGQPCLSLDDKILYFISDGYGAKGKDIFMTTYNRKAKKWANPTNLGSAVNTEGNEHFPFVHDDGYLYFASNGLPGMGGLDIFRIKLNDKGMPAAKAVAENMQFPINTGADDYALRFQPGGDEIGYMTSNRAGSKSQEDDIYAVVKTPLVFNIVGTITSSKTGKAIDQTTVKLEGGGKSFVVNTDKEGKYLFDGSKIDPDATYNITFEKSKFLANSGDVTTVGVDLSSFEFIPSENQFLHIITLDKKLDPIEIPIVLPNVFFDLAKARIKDESKIAFDSVVMILNNNPTIVIELRSHTDYRDSEEKNLALSQRRADSSVAYLVTKGIPRDRLVPVGKGESDPFVIPENYNGYGKGQFPVGTKLTEKYIKTLSPAQQEVANQINRRTDIKVLRDNYVPSATAKGGATDPNAGGDKEEEESVPVGEIYVMKGRESLGVVSKKFKISMVDLKKLNGGMRGVRPFEGLQIKVSKDGDYSEWDADHVQVKRPNQSLKAICKAEGLDYKAIDELNPDINKKAVPAGYWIRTQ